MADTRLSGEMSKTAHANVQNGPYWAVLDDQNGPRPESKMACGDVENGSCGFYSWKNYKFACIRWGGDCNELYCKIFAESATEQIKRNTLQLSHYASAYIEN